MAWSDIDNLDRHCVLLCLLLRKNAFLDLDPALPTTMSGGRASQIAATPLSRCELKRDSLLRIATQCSAEQCARIGAALHFRAVFPLDATKARKLLGAMLKRFELDNGTIGELVEALMLAKKRGAVDELEGSVGISFRAHMHELVPVSAAAVVC